MKGRFVISGLMIIFIALSFFSSIDTAITPDEINYITAGYTYWKTYDYRLNFEHPPLAKLIAGFPLLFITPNLNLTSIYWTDSIIPEYSYGNQWFFAKEFFYESGNNPNLLLFLGRFPFLLLGILLGAYVFIWANELYGKKAGIFALFLYVFCPNIIAYTQLAITDFALMTFFFITIYYYWKWRCNRKNKDMILTAIFFGLASATKLTSIYIIPIIMVLFLAEYFIKVRKATSAGVYFSEFLRINKKKLIHELRSFLSIFFIAFVIFAVSYMFINIEYYLEAIKVTFIHSTTGHPSYLLGQYSTEGWWYYFIVTFIIKTPVPLLIFLICTFVFTRKIDQENFLSESILFIPLLIYLVAFMFNDINIGIRHILIVYPFIFVFSSKLLTYKIEKTYIQSGITIIFSLLCLWYVASAIFIFPHYLSYFNEIVGGPNNGQKFLLDSNIDWGQDVIRLEKWLMDNNLKNNTIYYSVFTIEPPEYRGFHNKSISCLPHAGLYAVSVNRLYDLGQIKHGCLDWLKEQTPTTKIGYSIFIYNISTPELLYQEQICAPECQEVCTLNNKNYNDYRFVDECICICD